MKLVLFCDYGIDDAAATADALFHAARDGYDGAAIVAVGGNVPPEISLANAKKLVAHLPFKTVPVCLVDTCALRQPFRFLKKIHGGDGMGDLFSDDAGFCAPVLPFEDWLAHWSEPYDFLSLGPMTLVLRMLRHRRPRRFVFMGGNIAERPNYEGYEFNHALDRAAFADVVRVYEHIAVTLDTCRHPLLNVQNDPPEARSLLASIVRRAREMTFVSGEKGSYIWDDMAVKALRHPDWFGYERAADRDGNVLTVARYTYGRPYGEIIDR